MRRRAPDDPNPALIEMLARDKANGVDVGIGERFAPGPPEVAQPLIRPTPPPPDWRKEEARAEAARLKQDSYPARPRSRSRVCCATRPRRSP